MRDIALEVPLRALPFRWGRESHDTAVARVEQRHDPLDHATFSSRVSSLEQDDHPQVSISNPFLELDQLDLKAPELLFVLLASDGDESRRLLRLLLLSGRHLVQHCSNRSRVVLWAFQVLRAQVLERLVRGASVGDHGLSAFCEL